MAGNSILRDTGWSADQVFRPSLNPMTKRRGSRAIRIFAGRMGTLDNTSVKSFHIATEAPKEFDAVQVIFGNTSHTNSYYVTACKVSVMANWSDPLNNSATWVNAESQDEAPIPIACAPHIVSGNVGRIAYTLTDVTSISSVARDDGGEHPIVCARAYINDSNAALPCYGNGTDNFTNWATRTDGRRWLARTFTGDGVSTPANFTGGTSGTNASQSPIVGMVFYCRGEVVNVAVAGDSIDEGRGTYLGEGYAFPAVEELNSVTGIGWELANTAWSGSSMYAANRSSTLRAIDLLNSPLCPDILVFNGGSPNDVGASTIDDADRQGWRRSIAWVADECAKQGVQLVVRTMTPVRYASFPFGSSDSLRIAHNEDILALQHQGIYVIDASSIFSGDVDTANGGQINPKDGDGTHPGDGTNRLIADVLKPVLVSAAGQR